MRHSRNDRDEVKELLRTRIEDLCLKLLPDGKREGRLWVSYNPVTGDYERSSPELKVALTGDRGAWKDWRSGDKGDVLGLITYVYGHTSFTETMRWARDWLGLNALTREARAELERAARKSSQESAAKAEQDRLRKIANAERRFLSGSAFATGIPAELHARAYMRHRLTNRHTGESYDLAEIENFAADSYRFHHDLEYWTLAEWAVENGYRRKVKDGPHFPGFLSAMRVATGQITAVHVTFLDPTTPRKINLGKKHPAKLMLGEAKGAAIWISHGPENMPIWEATEPHPLIIGEGNETVWPLALTIPEARCCAAGSISNIANVPVWLPSVSYVLIARDNNHNNDQAQKQLKDAMAALEQHGKPVKLMASTLGDDFNDLMRGEE